MLCGQLRYPRQRPGRGDQRGSIVILALVLLVMVTLVGTSATTTSTIEIQIAGNERTYKQNFYQAEATAMRAMTQLEALAAATLRTNNGGTIKTDSFLHDAANPTNFQTLSNWQQLGSAENYYLQCNLGTTDMDMTAPTHVYSFAVYGQAQGPGGNRSIIQVGYKRRY